MFVTYSVKPYSLSHGTKAELFYSFNRNDNEACEIEDEDDESDQSVDAADLRVNFDEI